MAKPSNKVPRNRVDQLALFLAHAGRKAVGTPEHQEFISLLNEPVLEGTGKALDVLYETEPEGNRKAAQETLQEIIGSVMPTAVASAFDAFPERIRPVQLWAVEQRYRGNDPADIRQAKLEKRSKDEILIWQDWLVTFSLEALPGTAWDVIKVHVDQHSRRFCQEAGTLNYLLLLLILGRSPGSTTNATDKAPSAAASLAGKLLDAAIDRQEIYVANKIISNTSRTSLARRASVEDPSRLIPAEFPRHRVDELTDFQRRALDYARDAIWSSALRALDIGQVIWSSKSFVIRKGTNDFRRSLYEVIGVSEHHYDKFCRLAGEIRDLEDAMENPPQESHLRQEIAEKLEDLRLELENMVVSPPAPLDDQHHAIADAEAGNPRETIARQEQIEFLKRALANLDPDERTVIELRYLNDEKPKSIREISENMNISASKVRKLEQSALKKLLGWLDGDDFGPLRRGLR